MLSGSDLGFLITLALILALSYYFLIMRKPTISDTELREMAHPNRENEELVDENDRGGAEGTRDARKRAKREEREARRQAVEAMKKAEEERLKRQEEKEKEEKEKEMKEEEKAKKELEEKKKKDEEEYEKWKKFLVLENEGDAISEQKSNENLLERFLNYISLRKVVEVEELAAAFKLTNKDCIQRIRDLEASERLTGVLDDRGKYIFIKSEEIEGLLKMIKGKGKLTKSELISEFSRLVSLEPDEEAVKKIKEQDASLNKEFEMELNKMVSEEGKSK